MPINNCLNSTFINTQGNLNETRNFTQQDNQFQSHLVNEEIVETMLTKTPQSSYTYNYKKKKRSISAYNHTIHGKTFRYSKRFRNGLLNI